MASLREFDIPGKPFGGKRQLANVVTVEFRGSYLRETYDARELQLRPGDSVVVDTERGAAIARVRSFVERRLIDGALPQVLRKATPQDTAHAERHEAAEREAYQFAIDRIRSRKLEMKLVRAQWIHDGSKVVFYFSAEGRVDFRDLVKDLAHRFRTRIEMHQIGVRDGARMLGGVGPCGRELCCSTFLENFAPVSIRMAKDQGLSLNPQKLSGMCGRLMCCLVYEQHVYRALKHRLPRRGTKVVTEWGPGRVVELDIINERVNVELEEGSRKLLHRTEVVVPGADDDMFVPPAPKVEYHWGEFSARERKSEDSGDGSGAGRRRRRRGGRRSQGGQRSKGPSDTGSTRDGQPKKKAKASGDAKPSKPPKTDGDSAQPKRKRRRRRKKKGGSGGGESGGGGSGGDGKKS